VGRDDRAQSNIDMETRMEARVPLLVVLRYWLLAPDMVIVSSLTRLIFQLEDRGRYSAVRPSPLAAASSNRLFAVASALRARAHKEAPLPLPAPVKLLIPVEASLFEVVSQSLLVAVAPIAVYRDIGRCSFGVDATSMPALTLRRPRRVTPILHLHLLQPRRSHSRIIAGAAMLRYNSPGLRFTLARGKEEERGRERSSF
jgi:hypothetical protein